MGCAKSLFYFLNFIFWLSGAALLGIGVWLLVDQSTLSNVIKFLTEIDGMDYETDSLDIVAYLFIAVGAFVFVVGFCGCCGAVRDVSCVMGLYIFFLVVVLIVEIGAGVLAVIYRDQLLDRIEKNGAAYIHMDYDGTKDADYGLHFIQNNWECCGVKGHFDFRNSTFSTAAGKSVSDFCCKMNMGYEFDERNADIASETLCMTEASACITGRCPEPTTQVHPKGCLTSIEDWIKDNLPIFIGVGIGVGCFELLVIIMAIVVCRRIGSEK